MERTEAKEEEEENKLYTLTNNIQQSTNEKPDTMLYLHNESIWKKYKNNQNIMLMQ